jgi:hypothetical protein
MIMCIESNFFTSIENLHPNLHLEKPVIYNIGGVVITGPTGDIAPAQTQNIHIGSSICDTGLNGKSISGFMLSRITTKAGVPVDGHTYIGLENLW